MCCDFITNYECFKLIISSLNLRYEDEYYLNGFLDAIDSEYSIAASPFILKLVESINRRSYND